MTLIIICDEKGLSLRALAIFQMTT